MRPLREIEADLEEANAAVVAAQLRVTTLWNERRAAQRSRIEAMRAMYLVGRTHAEIARELGLTVPAVRGALWRAGLTDQVRDQIRRSAPVDGHWLGTSADNSHDMAVKGRAGALRMTGERGSNAKLTEAQVLQVLASREKGRALAERFGVSKSTISMIRSGRNWAYLRRSAP